MPKYAYNFYHNLLWNVTDKKLSFPQCKGKVASRSFLYMLIFVSNP